MTSTTAPTVLRSAAPSPAPSAAQTAAQTGLLRWVLHPNPARGLRFARSSGWDYWPYDRLAAQVCELAGGLAGAGVEDGDVVAMVAPNGPSFVTAFFATMLAGGTPAPLAPPAFGQDLAAYRTELASRLRLARPRLVLTVPRLREAIAPGAAAAGTRAMCLADLRCERGPGRADGPLAELALLQFTSGSTGRPRAVRVPYRALEANAGAIGAWLGIGPGDATASWLPMYHDMGLVGCLVTPVLQQSDLWVMSPEQFLRDPLRFLQCFGTRAAALTAMPPFGLEHIARRVVPADLSNCDFSGWRAVIVGSQRISGRVLDRFARALAPAGFARRALLPAYGLAEATLAVTGLPLPQQWAGFSPDPRSLAVGHRVQALPGTDSMLVGCGPPLRDVVVTIRSDDGTPLPEQHLGEIVVEGPSVSAGYHDGGAASSVSRLAAGQLYTGDIGFLRAGQLFVLGRRGDSIKVRGRTVSVDDIEVSLQDHGLAAHRLAVLLGHDAHGAVAVLVVEGRDDGHLASGKSVLTRMADGARIDVIRVPAGEIPRTTSGKVRRAVLWNRYLAGRLTPPGLIRRGPEPPDGPRPDGEETT